MIYRRRVFNEHLMEHRLIQVCRCARGEKLASRVLLPRRASRIQVARQLWLMRAEMRIEFARHEKARAAQPAHQDASLSQYFQAQTTT